MERSPVELRILGSLVEKQLTTPDNYPLSTNALVAACNQRTNREPVVDYDERTVDTVMLELRRDGLARTVTGGRTNKHRHVLDEALGLDPRALSLLSVLMLRGPQTVGELRIRTERMADFIDLDEVESTLEELAGREPALVVRLDRRPGQKEPRWRHLLGGPDTDDHHVDASPARGHGPSAAAPSATAAASGASDPGIIDGLVAEVARLRADVDRLYALLGEDAHDPESGFAADDAAAAGAADDAAAAEDEE